LVRLAGGRLFQGLQVKYNCPVLASIKTAASAVMDGGAALAGQEIAKVKKTNKKKIRFLLGVSLLII
jgi:hypothetical protein